MDTLTVVHLETFEVSPMLQEVVSTITPLVAKNGNRLEVRCAEGLGALQADLTKVRQALFNLLSNACKFTSSGVITLAVVRERVAGANWLHFGVQRHRDRYFPAFLLAWFGISRATPSRYVQ